MNPHIAHNWTLERLSEIKTDIQSFDPADGEVFSLWAGYLIGTNHRFLEGMENHFGIPAARKISAPDRERYRVSSLEGHLASLRAGKGNLAILTKQQYRGAVKQTLEQQCFALFSERGGVLVLSRGDGKTCLE